jgi:glycosyltransferase involved in cell wall biosynthesis
MRVTFVLAGADLSGGNRVISIYADRLQRRGHQVTIVSRVRRRVTLKAKTRAFLRRQPIPVNRASWPSHFEALTGIEHRQIKEYRAITADDVPDGDVVIATWWETAEWVAGFPASKGAKAYFIQHYEAHEGQDVQRVDATWRLPMHKIIIAQWLVEIAREKFGDRDVSLVPNAVDLEQFHAEARGKQAKPTVGLMYSIVGFKGYDVSLKSIELARKAISDLRVVSFGNRKPIRSLPLPADTDYTMQPAQDRIREIYSKCDVWLVASRSEGFGLPILEAMACRTPVIATPTGAAPELIAGGGGVLVPFEDPAAMASEIQRIVGLPEKQWQAMSEAAYATASRYTWEDATTLFEAAISKNPPKARG